MSASPGEHSTDSSPWTTHTSDVVYDNAWIQVTHREVTTPTGTPGIYGLVHFKNRALAVVPIDDADHTWLVGQYRYGTDHYSWEVPEGGGPLGEDPLDAARRELLEECGLHAERLELILKTELSNSVTDEQAHVYVATGLTAGRAEPDDTELLAVRRLPVDDAIRMALTGEITDSLSLIALFRLALLRSRQ